VGHTVHRREHRADGRRIAVGGGDREVKVRSADTGRLLRSLKGHTNAVEGVVFLTDKRLASSSWDNTVKVWDVETGKEKATLSGHGGAVNMAVFTRDGKTNGRGPRPEPDSPNADLMAQFLNERDGQTFQSIPVIVFYAKDFTPLYRYTEFPAVYRKDRIRAVLDDAGFMEMLGSPFFEVWRSAALAEWTSLLYERLRVGSLA